MREKELLYGIDRSIYDIIKSINSLHKKAWNDVCVYGRVHRVLKTDNYQPCIHEGDREYKKVFLNDKLNGEIGFYIKTRNYNNYVHTAEMDVIYTIRLDKVRMSDEQALNYCEYILQLANSGHQITDIKQGVNTVFSDFDTTAISHKDVYPWHVFSFATSLTYDNNITNCDS